MRAMIVKYLAYFVIFWSFLSNHGAEGIQLSKQERLEWKKQFKLLKKPSIKTIKTKYGDIYDCVDFYKQPAFDHPLLKNHSFHPQMRPSFYPQWINASSTSSKAKEIPLDSLKLNDGGCPVGTVPIRRISKDDFIRIKRFTEDHASRTNPNGPPPGTNFAVTQTISNPATTIYYGVQGHLGIYNLPVAASHYSSGELIAQNGADRIQVGWTINPTVNKDNRTRLFQYLNAGQSHCFNLLCPGFVSVRQDIPIDIVLEPVSKVGETREYLPLIIYMDTILGNWWLGYGTKGIVIGFWPAKIFTELSRSATYIAVGGETYTTPGHPLTQMGSGFGSLTKDIDYSAHVYNILVLDDKFNYVDPQETASYVTDDHYGVVDEGQVDDLGRLIVYGGMKG